MADYDTLISWMRQLLGDIDDDEWDATVLEYCLKTALVRYASAYERVETRIVAIEGSGLFGLSLVNWAGDKLNEVAYLHWPAGITVGATIMENKILDYWYYRYGAAGAEHVYFDCVVEGTSYPQDNDNFLVTGVTEHKINGLESATYTTVPTTHWGVLAIGGAAYALRSRESGLSVTAGTEPGFIDAYHVGVLAGLSDRMMEDFDRELETIKAKRLERPPWGMAERRRMRRVSMG